MRKSLIAVLLAVTLAACGSDKKPSSAASKKLKADETTTTLPGDAKLGDPLAGSADAKAGSSNSGGGPTTTAKPGSAGGSGGSGGADGTTSTTKPHRPVSAKLDKSCIKKGSSDLQGITVNTDPGDTVAYSSVYSDNSNEMSHPSYKSGSGYGKASTDGVYKATWALPPDAPTGKTTVNYIAEGSIHQNELTFTIVGPLENCP